MPCSLIANVNILNISIYSIFICKFDEILCKVSDYFPKGIFQSHPKIYMDNQSYQNIPKVLKNNQIIKIYYKTIVTLRIIAIGPENTDKIRIP